MDVSNWLRGNTHAHTTRSDGDATVEQVVAFYAERGYDFLVITDHNRFLAPAEFPCELPANFVLIGGSELSYKSLRPARPIHVCAVGGTGADWLDRNAVYRTTPRASARAAVAAARRAGSLPIVCHPCWNWALSAADLLTLDGTFLLEVFNPSSGCNTYGGGGVDSPEDIWSRLLTAGRRVWAVAADDAHNIAAPVVPPVDGGAIGWVRVGAEQRTAMAIVAAMSAGRFYTSTGVELAEWSAGPKVYSLRVQAVEDRKYSIRLLGRDNRELATVHGQEASWTPRGDELFIRATVQDTNGGRCWTQPWFV